MNRRRTATIRDVAAHAGVSVKTVSNVVNDYVHVSDATRARVHAALDELGYRPNLSARHLRRGRSGLIGLAVPELDVPYFAELARHVIREAAARSLTVIIDQTDGDPELERLVLRNSRGLLLDGAILSPLSLTAADLQQRSDTTPLVLIGEHVGAGPADHVAIDNVAAAHAATRHLVEHGRRRIAAIGPQPGTLTQAAQWRLRGYQDALQEAGIEHDPSLLGFAPLWHRREGAAAMHSLLDRSDPPDGVFAFNDLLALGAMRTVLERGLHVPEDVAIVGFDDIDETRYATPTLSTISPDKAQIAALAVEMLADRIVLGPDGPARTASASYVLRARESTLGRPG